MSAQLIDVTVVIPTFNGADYLAEVLDAIAGQDFDGTVETLVIDSGSTDGTLDIVRARPDVRLHEIPNSEFGHGKTRNLAARLAAGRMIAYLTQDAIPAHPHWLRELTAPLATAAAVTGRQIPRPGCFPLLKYEIEASFAALGPADSVTIVSKADGVDLDSISFYSDVNSATMRSFLLDVIPYQDLPYSEDFAFAKDLLAAGYSKAYAPAGSVIHSNDLTLGEYRKRVFDETVALRRIGHGVPLVTRGRQFVRSGYGVLRDSAKIVADHDFSGTQKLTWLLRNPWYQVAKWQSLYLATHVSLDDHDAIARGSLEDQKRRKN
jgi:rhamnosyltransferase